MKLRTRLFLWIGLLFCLAFVLSYYLETRLAKKNLRAGQAQLHQTILQILEEKRVHLEEYLNIIISDNQADIDALLLHIGRDPNLANLLFLSPAKMDLGASAWVNTSLLFVMSDALAFAQTTRDGRAAAVIAPVDIPLDHAKRFPVDSQKELAWIFAPDDRDLTNPYVGIKLHLGNSDPNRPVMPHLLEELVVENWEIYALFTPEVVFNFEMPDTLTTEVQKDFLSPNVLLLLSALDQGAQFLHSKAKDLNALDSWIAHQVIAPLQTQLEMPPPPDPRLSCHQRTSHSREINHSLLEILQKREQVVMISTLLSILPTGIFGSNPLNPEGPSGIAHFGDSKAVNGELVLGREVFFTKPQFDDTAFYAAHNVGDPYCKGLASSTAVITSTDFDRVFIGNTLKMATKGHTGYLTVGLDGDILLNQMALALNETIFLVHQNQVLSAMSAQGVKLSHPEKDFILTPEMLTNVSGTVQWQGNSYFYLKMTPFQDVDLHFYAIQPSAEAFVFLNTLEKSSQHLLSDISKHMRIVALIALIVTLFVLHKISAQVTRPVSALAKATQSVAAGQLEDVQLPPVSTNKHDEMNALILSFDAMVQGLKEKEKVKGVLNKVVSKEIAQEILKGTIHLGGEEKKVTVLFADIRNFTHLSNGMAPHLVIEMLNECMTLVSHVIDQFGGVIDKYVGDEVMALFGAPLDRGDSALKAVLCALEMVKVLNAWNEKRKARGLSAIEMGIGIHTGKMLVGNMGAENRLNYTVIGSNVNLAARLCSAAKGMQILISEHTLAEQGVKDKIVAERLEPMQLKGFDEKVEVYAIHV